MRYDGYDISVQFEFSLFQLTDGTKKLSAAFDVVYQQNRDKLKMSMSLAERHTNAMFLADDIPRSPIEPQREISHIHGTSDYSMHVTLSPVDCKWPLGIIEGRLVII